MNQFITIDHIFKIPSDPQWSSVDFAEKNRVVDENGQPFTVDYQGRCYKLHTKQMEQLPFWRKLGIALEAIWIMISSFGREQFSAAYQHLLNQRSKIRYFGIPTDRPFKERVDKAPSDFSFRLPKEMCHLILSFLNPEHLAKCLRVNKNLKEFANHEPLWDALASKISTFGKEQWKTYFGEDIDIGEVPPLPRKIHEIRESRCPFNPNEKVKDTHDLLFIPKTLNGKNLNLETFDKLARSRELEIYDVAELTSYSTDAAEQSSWILITKKPVEFGVEFGYGVMDFVELSRLLLLYKFARNHSSVNYSLPNLRNLIICNFLQILNKEPSITIDHLGSMIDVLRGILITKSKKSFVVRFSHTNFLRHVMPQRIIASQS